MVNREIMTFVSKHKVLSIILLALIVFVIYPFALFILFDWLPPGSTVSLPFNLGGVGKSPLDLNKLQEENEKLKARNEEYIKDVEYNNKTIESQKSAIDKLKEENTKKDEEINNLKREVGSLKTEKQQISDKLISKESEAKNSNHTNKEFQEQIKQLRR
jgi:cell division protein FtsB